jgi:hypothetical protein
MGCFKEAKMVGNEGVLERERERGERGERGWALLDLRI